MELTRVPRGWCAVPPRAAELSRLAAPRPGPQSPRRTSPSLSPEQLLCTDSPREPAGKPPAPPAGSFPSAWHPSRGRGPVPAAELPGPKAPHETGRGNSGSLLPLPQEPRCGHGQRWRTSPTEGRKPECSRLGRKGEPSPARSCGAEGGREGALRGSAEAGVTAGRACEQRVPARHPNTRPAAAQGKRRLQGQAAAW